MKRRLPEHAFKYLNHLIGPGSEFMEGFEKLKRPFGSSTTQKPFPLLLPIRIGREACGMSGFDKRTDTFVLTVEDVQSLFDPIVYNVIGLVNSQIAAAGREYGRLQRALYQCFEVPGRSSVHNSHPLGSVSFHNSLFRLDSGRPSSKGLFDFHAACSYVRVSSVGEL